MTSSPYKLTATQVLELLKNNAITVEAYARSLLNRIKENDGTVKAWAHLGKLLPWLLAGPFANADSTSDPDLVLSQARALDQIPKDQRGPLHGLAIGVKDIMDTKDCPRSMALPFTKGISQVPIHLQLQFYEPRGLLFSVREPIDPLLTFSQTNLICRQNNNGRVRCHQLGARDD
jgi:hypothetical protein